jgi:hypothetical protein
VPRDLNCQGIGNHFPGFGLIVNPCAMRDRNPDWPAVGEEFDIDGIRVAGGNGNYDRLVGAVNLLIRPAVCGFEVIVHAEKYYQMQTFEPNVTTATSYP